MADYRMSAQPFCPYCNYLVRDAWEIISEMECSTEHECGSCEREFTISRSVIFYYSASALEQPE